MSAVQVNNHEYAISILQSIVGNNPGLLEGREVLRKCQAIKNSGKEAGGTKLFGMTIGGGSKPASPKAKAAAKKDPLSALPVIEAELNDDPFNPELNDLLHTCAASLAMLGTAEFALETLHQNNPKQTKYLHKLANFYIANNKFGKAAKVYQTIAKEDPTDAVAIKGEKDCMAKASMIESTQSVGGQATLKTRDDSLRLQLEKQSKTGLTKDQLAERRDELLNAYAANQHDLQTARGLGEIYEQLDDYSNAYTFYHWAFQLSENDATLISKADAMKNKANQQNIKAIEEALAADPENAELQAQLAEYKQVAIGERITECEARVQENPTDGTLRYELGKAYFDAGRPEDAIPHLQQAKSNPAIETKVLLLLGQTFDAKGMTDMAVNQLNQANERLLSMDGVKKEVLYQLAMLHDKAGDKDQYLASLKQIYEVDYGYRDVAQRVEAAY